MKRLAVSVSLATTVAICPVFAVDSIQEDNPSVRNAFGFVFHEGVGHAVLFGGADEQCVRSDTWGWNGTNWERLSESGPDGRTFPAMTYHAATQTALLFGGNSALFGNRRNVPNFFNDTWSFDGSVWRREVTETSPPPRAEAAVAYDPIRRESILFGGYIMDGREKVMHGDTWAWDGAHWRIRSEEGPSPRNGAAMAFVPDLEGILLYGGAGANNETWLWNGNAWRLLTTSNGVGRFNSSMAHHATENVTLRFGGWNGESRTADTWSYRDGEWTALGASGPAARNHAGAVYDSARGQVLLFGGHDGRNVFGDLWGWQRGEWTEILAESPRTRIRNGH